MSLWAALILCLSTMVGGGAVVYALLKKTWGDAEAARESEAQEGAKERARDIVDRLGVLAAERRLREAENAEILEEKLNRKPTLVEVDKFMKEFGGEDD